ncbi:MAG: Queuine tRNA-ribosyltransferase [Parcubacteria group bacterium GW2011_GWA1_36_12]|nr:MAG: Queuine tRNA-ribosyltransferase [Parcubacteria group bacterium GW2011_GWA1_36_12]
MFKITHKDKKTKARLGVLSTPHGKVLTPSYVFVGTYGHFLHLKPRDIKRAGSQLLIANTFHLWNKAEKNKNKKGFVHKSFGIKIPVMTDSGGFQVLSLAFGDKNKVGKFMTGEARVDSSYKRSKIRITQKGVHFNFKGKKSFLGPELSMKLQNKIGADIIFAFDQITSPLDDYEYNRKAVELTDKWAEICLKTRDPKQMLFGIVQGGLFKDLRIKSAKSIGSLPFDGFGIGGSYTKEQISKMLKWIVPHLPEEKPRHLLGVGKVADILEAVQNGVDTFDCVIPTREARHGRLYTKTGHMDIRKGKYVKDKKVIEKGCDCLTCSSKISRSKIRELIKSENMKLNAAGQRWCLMHNMWFFNNLLEDVRESIQKNKFSEFKKKTLKSFDKAK